ncbi:hypothetical protein PHYPSEUDO_007840 [Phytophthora pseudosyringae]|uniref:Uncharacterized protein n=1 Tax=Phytophthora pseudosyringae TaxID=221518 RepID=A0A8T1VIN3_9STRA|nr:hypothetical protein PHYPSEUDO_007840 [Phytophthora pseudosyringae]
MSGMHRVWSFYPDASCSGAATGVFMQRLNDRVGQVDSTGARCDAQYDSNNEVVGYLNESCHDDLYSGEPYMAYDYYFARTLETQLRIGDCESLYGLGPTGEQFRSATISVSDATLVWTRNMGTVDGALNCPGVGGEGYYEFDVRIAEVYTQTCKSFKYIDGGFIFYNASTTVSSMSTALGVGTIVGIACGIAVVMVVIIALVCCRRKKKQKS